MKSIARFAPVLALMLASAFATSLAAAQDAKTGTGSGDRAAGASKAQMCIGCHGIPDYKASFPEVYRVPKIAGQNEKYLVAALGEYKKGDRKHPTMRAIATSLSDQDMADLAAYYSSDGNAPVADTPVALTGAAGELIKRGNCVSCHGANFAKPIDPSYPKLAGQHPDYLVEALKAYQTEHNPQFGRNNAIMSAMAKPYSHAEMTTIAEFLSTLPSELRTNTQSRWR